MAQVSIPLVLLAVAGCVSEERAARDTDGAANDTAPADSAEVVSDPCPEVGARECLDLHTSRVCDAGQWRRTPCGEGQTCSRATGACADGELSCLGTLVCNIDCAQGEQGCSEACAQDATVSAVDALGELNDCQCDDDCWPILCGRLFPWPSFAEISACASEHCASQAASCVGGGEEGQGSCGDVRDCLLACEGDVFCAEGCFSQGSAEAQTTAAFYYLCVRDECGPDPSPSCLFQAQANRCADLWDACQGVTVSPGGGGGR